MNGYVRDMLARFPLGTRFNVPRFMWIELAIAMDDGRRNLPYAPYLMLIIDRVTGKKYPKDCTHTPYTPKKTSADDPGVATTETEEGNDEQEEE